MGSLAGCCARAASGQAIAVPPSAVMNCRLPIAIRPIPTGITPPRTDAEYHASTGQSVTSFAAVLAVFAAGACGRKWPKPALTAAQRSGRYRGNSGRDRRASKPPLLTRKGLNTAWVRCEKQFTPSRSDRSSYSMEAGRILSLDRVDGIWKFSAPQSISNEIHQVI